MRLSKSIAFLILFSLIDVPEASALTLRACYTQGLARTIGWIRGLTIDRKVDRLFPEPEIRPADHSARLLARDPWEIRQLLGRPNPKDPKPFIAPARSAFQYVDQHTKDYSYRGKAMVFDALARSLQESYDRYSVEGPFFLRSGSICYRGPAGLMIIFRQSDDQILVGTPLVDPIKSGNEPSYEDGTLTPLSDYLANTRRQKERERAAARQ